MKRLGIQIQKIIHVEHDKIATHVYRSNHDASYSDFAIADNDGIHHVYIPSFEALKKEFEENPHAFMKKYGPIDIVIGGPPCVDFSKINAHRQGVKGSQGNYMLELGRVIRTMEKIQKANNNHPLYYLVENVVTQGNDLDAIRAAFDMDWDPIKLNAASVSPCLRNRHFYSNIPPYLPHFFDGPWLESTPGKCLEQGFQVSSPLTWFS